MLVELDVAAVDMPQSAFGLLSEPGEQCIPEAAEAPPAELRVDRAPKPEFGWQFTPRRACAQDEKEGFEMRGHHFGSAPAPPGPGFDDYRMNEEALSRRASSILRVVWLNMAPSQRTSSSRLSKAALFAKTPLNPNLSVCREWDHEPGGPSSISASVLTQQNRPGMPEAALSVTKVYLWTLQ